jgi:hypothetical protein
MPVVFDLVMRLPLSVAAGYFLWREWLALEAAQGWLKVSAHVATMLFLALIAVLTLARHRPLRKSEGWLPRIAALAGLDALRAASLPARGARCGLGLRLARAAPRRELPVRGGAHPARAIVFRDA